MTPNRWERLVAYSYPLTATYLVVMTTLIVLLLLTRETTC